MPFSSHTCYQMAENTQLAGTVDKVEGKWSFVSTLRQERGLLASLAKVPACWIRLDLSPTRVGSSGHMEGAEVNNNKKLVLIIMFTSLYCQSKKLQLHYPATKEANAVYQSSRSSKDSTNVATIYMKVSPDYRLMMIWVISLLSSLMIISCC